jgi:hypothetical protein
MSLRSGIITIAAVMMVMAGVIAQTTRRFAALMDRLTSRRLHKQAGRSGGSVVIERRWGSRLSCPGGICRT